MSHRSRDPLIVAAEVIAIIALSVTFGILVFGWSQFDYWLYRYQTLSAFFVALIAASAAIAAARIQTEDQKSRSAEKKNEELVKAARLCFLTTRDIRREVLTRAERALGPKREERLQDLNAVAQAIHDELTPAAWLMEATAKLPTLYGAAVYSFYFSTRLIVARINDDADLRSVRQRVFLCAVCSEALYEAVSIAERDGSLPDEPRWSDGHGAAEKAEELELSTFDDVSAAFPFLTRDAREVMDTLGKVEPDVDRIY